MTMIYFQKGLKSFRTYQYAIGSVKIIKQHLFYDVSLTTQHILSKCNDIHQTGVLSITLPRKNRGGVEGFMAFRARRKWSLFITIGYRLNMCTLKKCYNDVDPLHPVSLLCLMWHFSITFDQYDV